MLTFVAIAAKPSERMLLKLLEDDRLLRHLPQMEAQLVADLADLCRMPEFTWQRLGFVLGCPSLEVQHETLLSAVAMSGWIWRDTLRELRHGIYALAIGDPAEQVAALQAGRIDCTSDTRIQQVKRVLDAGDPPEHVIHLLELMKDLPFSSTLVEEAHASGSVLKKHHSEYGEKTLRCRALLHQMRALFREGPLQRKIRRLDEKVCKLRSSQPQKVHARQALLRNLVKEYMSQEVNSTVTGAERKARAKQIMINLHAVHEGMSCQERAALQRDVQALRRQLAANLQEEVGKCLDERKELEKQLQESQAGGLKNHVGSCRLTDNEVEEIDELVHTTAFRKMTHADLECTSSPRAPLPEEIDRFEAKVKVLPGIPEVGHPWWAKLVCPNREFFRGVALRSENSPGVWHFVLFGKEQLYEVTFLGFLL